MRLSSSACHALLAALCFSCGGGGALGDGFAQRSAEPPASACPEAPMQALSSPDVEPKHRTAQFWLEKLSPEAADAPLLNDLARTRLTERAVAVEGAWRDPTSDDVVDPARVRTKLKERMDWMASMVDAGKYVETTAGTWAEAEAVTERAVPDDTIRLVLRETPLRCAPLDAPLFKPPVDPLFDRNACASLHPGELVRVRLREPEGTWMEVHAGHTVGWLHANALSMPLDAAAMAKRGGEPRLWVHRDGSSTRGGLRLRTGVSLPLVESGDPGVTVLVPGPQGWIEDVVPAAEGLLVGDAPVLTRRALFEAALSHLDAPYGWGGRAGERDCSRYARDLFAGFDVQLGRHSAVQAQLGVTLEDVGALDDGAKRAAIAKAAARGVVLLYMKGHIMLYLGHDAGRDYAVSSISEYLTPCEGGADTVNRLDRVAVTTLELGRGTQRRAFIERIQTLVVFEPLEIPS